MDQIQENKISIVAIKEEIAEQKLEYSIALVKIITQNDVIIEKLDESKEVVIEHKSRIEKLEKLDRFSIKKTLQVIAIICSIAASYIAIGGLL